MPELTWSTFASKHLTAHLVAAIVPVTRGPVAPSQVQELRQLMGKLVDRFKLSGDFAVKVARDTHVLALYISPEIHIAFERRDDADRLAAGVQARPASEYAGWASQRQFLLDPLAALDIAAALVEAGAWDDHPGEGREPTRGRAATL